MGATHNKFGNLTPYQKNGLELQILCEKAEQCQRNILHKHFPRDPTAFFNKLNEPENKKILDGLKKKKVLKDDQFSLLFPSSGLTDSSKFDMTLLSLLVRSLCGYRKPATGWNKDPDDADESDIADSIRFTLARNRIKHGSLSIPGDFIRCYLCLDKALIRQGCPQDELNTIKPKTRSLPSMKIKNNGITK